MNADLREGDGGDGPRATAGEAIAGGGEGAAEEVVLGAGEGAGERLDKFLASRLPGVSRARIQRWIDLGAVTCEERPLSRDTRLTGREQLRVVPQPREAEHAFRAEPVPLSVIAREPGFLVVDKPAGMVVHPAPGNWSGTMMNGLLHLDASLGCLPRAGIVHRLDKDTSGVLVVATTEAARSHLIEELSERRMRRTYLAVAHGRMSRAVRLDAPIGRDPRNRLRMAVQASGKPAITDVFPLAEGVDGALAFSVLRCRLQTGRTHQIRVHLAHAGHPLLGDAHYGGPRVTGLDRQALHAIELAFAHPDGGTAGPYRSKQGQDLLDWLAARGLDVNRIVRECLEAGP